MIKLGITRTFSRLKSRSNIVVFGQGADLCESLRHNVTVQTRQKMKLPRGGIHGQKTVEFYPKYDPSVGFAGYLMLSIPVTTFFLGVWQIKRYIWKLDIIDKVKARSTVEPIELPENPEDLRDKEFYPVKVRGKFLHEKEFNAGLRSFVDPNDSTPTQSGSLFSSNSSSTPGFHIITPFQLEDRDLTILVNRGWVPTKYRYPNSRKEAQTDETVEITGLIRLEESRPSFVPNNVPEQSLWFYRDVAGMARATGASPIYIEQTYNENQPANAPIGGQTRMSFRNDHLSYIITWFGLSIACGYLWYKRYIKKRPVF